MRSLFLLLALCLFPPTASAFLAIDPQECLDCHGDVVRPEEYADSVHGRNACTSCHQIADLLAHAAGRAPLPPVQCGRCHEEPAAQHYASIHMRAEIACSDCHRAIHRQQPWNGDKGRVVEVCSMCHSGADYVRSAHGQAVRAGNGAAAACHDCHGLHAIAGIGDPDSPAAREFHTRVCLQCHGDSALMEANGVFPLAVQTYWKSYHGKTYRLGFPRQAAGCSDCHRPHLILPASNPASSIHPERLVQTCGACHAKATANFTRYYVHGDYRDRQHYPLLFWTFIAMTALVVAVFAVFWVHLLLWLFRGFAANREKERELAEGRRQPLPDGHKLYRRFRWRHIFLHLLVIVSFLGLSLTGLPLKFSNQEWAHTLMAFFGGVHTAGHIHRACALLTFAYFLAALVMSVHFLFLRRDLAGNWRQRLFGPESLLPNRKDLADLEGMVRWFLFRGPKPAFERWTYWEKFDFLAVFWGMFAIGGSGLLLWFPEFFTRLLPGWVLNIALIIHSDEALLATGFIFTVHFFNTHGRPEKFPLDFVIFNGQLTKEEFVEERPAQWRRYEAAGNTETLRVRKASGILYDFLLRGLGFAALFTGSALAVLMLSAFLSG